MDCRTISCNKWINLLTENEKTERYKHYYENNKEKEKERVKNWYVNNKEKINEKCVCECGCIISICNKLRHLKSKKHQSYIQSIN
jgi:hypothetical protein